MCSSDLAGRAGRRGRSIASVITYAHGTSHDSHFFDHPEQIISGDVRAPIVYIENQQVLERHIHAYLVQRFFHERVPPDRAWDRVGAVWQPEPQWREFVRMVLRRHGIEYDPF